MGVDKNVQNIDDAIKEVKRLIDDIEWERGDAEPLRRRLKALKELRDAGSKFVPRF